MELLSNIESLVAKIESPSHEQLSELKENEELFEVLTQGSLGILKSLNLSGKLQESFFDTHSSRVEHQVVVHDLKDYDSNPEVRKAFIRYLKYSRYTWIDLFRKGQTALILDPDEYIANYAKEGFKLIEVQGVAKLDNEKQIQHGLAYGLIGTDKDSIADLADFPEHIRKEKNVIRLNEVINVSLVGNFHYPSGSLLDLVFDEIIKIATEKESKYEPIIITRIVVGERTNGAKEETHKFANVGSQKALNKRNFKREGTIEIETFLDKHPGVRDKRLDMTLLDGVYVWRRGNETRAKQLADLKKDRLEAYVLDQILCTSSFPIGSKIACFSDSFSNFVDYALAEKHKNSGVVVVHMDEKFIPTYRQNLDHVIATSKGVITKENTLDAIFSNNVLRKAAIAGEHKPRENAVLYLYNQLAQLREGGHYAAREVLVPGTWPSRVVMELNEDSASYFRKYCKDIGLACKEEAKNRFEVLKAEAIKFVYLINPYRDEEDYAKLKKLPAPLFAPEEYLTVLRAFDIRIDNAKPFFTDFVQEKFIDDFDIKFYDLSGKRLSSPPNQFELIGRKVSVESPVAIRPKEIRELNNPKYIKSRYFKNEQGDIRQLISRSGRNVFSLFPVSHINGEPAIPIRESYPRGIPLAFFGKNSDNKDISMDGTIRSGFHMESIAVSLDEYDDDELYKKIVEGLKKYTLLTDEDIPSKEILLASLSGKSIPSSSSVDEVWKSISFELENIDFTQVMEEGRNSFSDKSLIRSVLLKDIVGIGESAGPVSGALLQFAYEYYLNNKIKLPKYNCRAVKLNNQNIDIKVHTKDKLHHSGLKSDSPVWKEIEKEVEKSDFYELKEVDFVQVNGKGNEIDGVETLEVATVSKSKKLTNNTYVICPCAIVNGKPVVFLETRDDLPLIYEELELVKPEVIPAYRVKIDTALKDNKDIDLEMISIFERDNGLKVVKKDGVPVVYNHSPELLVAPGIIPERATLKLVEVDVSQMKNSRLRAFDLEELVKNSKSLFCGHTKNALFRAWHALSSCKK